MVGVATKLSVSHFVGFRKLLGNRNGHDLDKFVFRASKRILAFLKQSNVSKQFTSTTINKAIKSLLHRHTKIF